MIIMLGRKRVGVSIQEHASVQKRIKAEEVPQVADTTQMSSTPPQQMWSKTLRRFSYEQWMTEMTKNGVSREEANKVWIVIQSDEFWLSRP